MMARLIMGFNVRLTGVPTIQATIEQAIQAISNQNINIVAAGRTDTGCSCELGKVIAFDLEVAT